MTLLEVKEKYPVCATYKLGDNKDLCDELISLVFSGKKTATCEALREFESGNHTMPIVGGINIVLNWDGSPALAIRTLSVEIEKFNEVGELFALAEGENDCLKGWQLEHQAYFDRNGGFDQEMELVCERFELIEAYGKMVHDVGHSA